MDTNYDLNCLYNAIANFNKLVKFKYLTSLI